MYTNVWLAMRVVSYRQERFVVTMVFMERVVSRGVHVVIRGIPIYSVCNQLSEIIECGYTLIDNV